MPGVPLMYVNSGSYPPPTMVSNGTFGHQVGHNGTSPAPPGTYMTPALVPNLVFRQNVPVSWYYCKREMEKNSTIIIILLLLLFRSLLVFELQRQVILRKRAGRRLQHTSCSEVGAGTEAHNPNHATHCQCIRVSILSKVRYIYTFRIFIGFDIF